MTLSVYLEIRKLTKLPKNWSGQSQLPPLQNGESGRFDISADEVSDYAGGIATNIESIFFPSSPVAVTAPHPESQERFSTHFWGCWL